MGIPISLTYSLAAADDDGICQSQTPLGAGNLLINGVLAANGVATLDHQRQVLFTFAADESGHTFTLYGTNSSGTSISEQVSGTGTTAVSTLDYKTVTRVAIDTAATGAIKVGTNGVGATPWQSSNMHIAPSNTSIGTVVSGTVNYTVQVTYDIDPCGITSNTPVTAANTFNLASLTSKSASGEGMISGPVSAWRLQINSGTGSVKVYAIQAGIEG